MKQTNFVTIFMKSETPNDGKIRLVRLLNMYCKVGSWLTKYFRQLHQGQNNDQYYLLVKWFKKFAKFL